MICILNLDRDEPVLHDELDVLQANLSLVNQISYGAINADIYSTIEHPLKAFTLLVANKGLYEVRADGSCRTLAGAIEGNCTKQSNRRNVGKVFDLAVLNLEMLPYHTLPVPQGVEQVLLVPDDAMGCVHMFDLLDITAALPCLVGKYGEHWIMADETEIPLADFRLMRPRKISISYSSEVIRIIVNCKEDTSIYQVVITITPDKAVAHQFRDDTELYVSSASSIYGALRSESLWPYTSCYQSRVISDIHESLEFSCNQSSWFNPYVPVLYMGAFVAPINRHLEALEWPDGHVRLNVNGIDFHHMPISFISRANLVNGGLLLTSTTLKTVYFVDDERQRRNEVQGHSAFEVFQDGQQCGGHILSEFNIKSLETCASTCALYSVCRAFTFYQMTHNDFFCSLHSVQSIGRTAPNSTCYFFKFG